MRVEIDRHELIALAMEKTALNDGQWHRWTRVKECLADERQWNPEQQLSDATWKRWMADEAPGITPTTRGLLRVMKDGERSPVMVKLTASAGVECASHSEKHSES